MSDSSAYTPARVRTTPPLAFKAVPFVPFSGADRKRFPNEFAKLLNLDTSPSILLMVSPYCDRLHDQLSEIGYDDIDCTEHAEDAFNRASYFRFDLIIGIVSLDNMLTEHQVDYGSMLVQTGDETLLKSGDPKFFTPSFRTEELAQRLAQLTKHAQPEVADKRQPARSPQH